MKYKALKIREDIAKEFVKRAKAIGLTYTDFMKRLLVDYDNRKFREFKELISTLESIHERLQEIETLLLHQKVQENQSGERKVLLAIRELAKKLIVLQDKRKDFDEFILKLLAEELTE